MGRAESPGGGSDNVARTLAKAMGKTFGHTLIHNNRPGAATHIGAAYVAKAKPDGHVVRTTKMAMLAADPSLYSKLPYDPSATSRRSGGWRAFR